jgi:tRNA threonylcarbamoyladenosine biosynthesis protein TsaE
MQSVGEPSASESSTARGPADRLVVRTASAEETRHVGDRVGALMTAGDLVLLGGDLGAGKTTFTQGLARALGVEEPVTSPTFTLVHSYDGADLRLLHVDVYRLDRLQEVVDLGLPELLEDGAVGVVEWGQRAAPALPPDHLDIRICFGPGVDDRLVVLEPTGESWLGRRPALDAIVEGGSA